MRDVWFPLDLSNAASFYGMMAHAAAHLAYLRGEKNSVEVLKFKSEATSLVNRWLSNSATRLSDHTFAAVVRLLTFEVWKPRAILSQIMTEFNPYRDTGVPRSCGGSIVEGWSA